MKKACFRILVLFLLGCNDSEEFSPSLESTLSGSWTKGPIRLQYFDASGEIDFEDTVPHEMGVIYTFDRGEIRAVDSDGEVFRGVCRVLERDSGQLVQVTVGYRTRYYRIVDITADRLVWESDFEYLDYLDQSWKTAAKAVRTEEFSR